MNITNWSIVPVKTVCELIVDCVNRTAPLEDGVTPYRMIRTTDIRDGKLNFKDARYVNKEIFDRWTRRASVETGDVLLTREAPIGEVCRIPNDENHYFLGQRIIQYRAAPKKIDPLFLYYSFCSNFLKNQFLAHDGSGSVVSHIRVADCHEFKIPLAPLSEQISIGKILAALDDKIDLNRRTNETLEAMARALFRDWFVDFGPTRAKMAGQTPYLAPEIWELFPDRLDDEGKPEGWGVTTLGNLAETCGENISPEAVGPETPYVGLEHLPRHSLALTDWGTADKVTSGKSRFLRGNILFGKLRPYFHKVVIAPVSGICSTDIVVIDSKKTFFRSIVRLLCSSEDFVEFTDRTSQGTKMPRTSWTAMRSYELTRIPDDVASIFEDFASPNFFKIERNIRESRSLVQLRDLLLPKLMSGEIRIRDAEKMLADAL